MSPNAIELTLEGRIPSKKNSRVTNRKTGRSFPSAAYKEWEKAAREALEAAWPGEPSDKRFFVRVTIYGLRNDLDNALGSIYDAAKGIVYHDDRQIDMTLIRRYPVLKGYTRRAVLRFEEMDPEPHYPHACEMCGSPAGQAYVECLWYCWPCLEKERLEKKEEDE